MLVFAKKKIALLAMPKTGTSAFEIALSPKADIVFRDPPSLKHTGAQQFNQSLRPLLASKNLHDLELICVLRHPVSWLGSWYRYRSRPYLDGQPNSTKGMTFDTFVNEYLKGKPEPYAQVGKPEKFIRKNGGGILVDHLYQYEQLDLLVDFLQDRLDTAIDLRESNVSPQGDLTLSDNTLAKLMRKRPLMFADWKQAHR